MSSPFGAFVKLGAIVRLRPEQIYGHVRRRLRNKIVPKFAGRYRAGLERAAATLPPFAPVAEAVPLARMITQFYAAEYRETVPSCFDGRFNLMSKIVDFGSVEAIDWRIAADEGARQIWRSNLSQMGYLPVAMEMEPERAFAFAAKLVRQFRASARFEISRDFVEIWHPYIASRRVLSLASVLLLAPEHLRGSRDWADIEAFMRLNVVYVQRNLEVDLGFNHLERNLAALALFCLCCAQPPAEIAATLLATFDAVVRRTICDDGVPEERSGMYHALTIESFKIYRALPIWSSEQAALLEKRLADLETTLAALTLGDGYPMMFNDAWLGENPATRDIVGDRQIGFHVMPEGGYVRFADGAWVAVMDAGPIGPYENPGHGHADYLSIEASIGSRRFLVDPGTLLYTAGPLRDNLRSWEAHNGPVFVGERPVTFIDSFKVGRHAAAVLDEAGEDPDGTQHARGSLAFGHLRVARTASLSKGTMTIRDEWTGAGTRRSRFLIPAGWTLERQPETILLRAGEDVVTMSWTGADAAVGEATWSLYYRVEEKAHEIVLTPRGESLEVRFALAGTAPPNG